MPSDEPAVTFDPVTHDDRALLLQWLNSAHAQEWWGDPEEELSLIYDGRGKHDPFIARVGGAPVAYVQAWRPSLHPELPWQHDLPDTVRGIDITIGDAANLGRGLGTLILRCFAAKLFAEGATRIVIDPDSRNERAIAAYLKVGFRPYDRFEEDGSSDILMELFRSDLDHAPTGEER